VANRYFTKKEVLAKVVPAKHEERFVNVSRRGYSLAWGEGVGHEVVPHFVAVSSKTSNHKLLALLDSGGFVDMMGDGVEVGVSVIGPVRDFRASREGSSEGVLISDSIIGGVHVAVFIRGRGREVSEEGFLCWIIIGGGAQQLGEEVGRVSILSVQLRLIIYAWVPVLILLDCREARGDICKQHVHQAHCHLNNAHKSGVSILRCYNWQGLRLVMINQRFRHVGGHDRWSRGRVTRALHLSQDRQNCRLHEARGDRCRDLAGREICLHRSLVHSARGGRWGWAGSVRDAAGDLGRVSAVVFAAGMTSFRLGVDMQFGHGKLGCLFMLVGLDGKSMLEGSKTLVLLGPGVGFLLLPLRDEGVGLPCFKILFCLHQGRGLKVLEGCVVHALGFLSGVGFCLIDLLLVPSVKLVAEGLCQSLGSLVDKGFTEMMLHCLEEAV